MTTDENALAQLQEALEEARLDVERLGDTLNVSRGSGAMEAKANVDPVDFLNEIGELDDRQRRRRIAGWVSGVQHVLLEPGDSDADQWDFTESAGSLAMALQVDSFVDGCRAAAGSPAWSQPFDEDIVYVFLLELDMGIRVLTDAQFERWSATRDRVVAGARSMLFHKAQPVSPNRLEDYSGVEQLRVGDGYDAARALVLEDLMFGEFDDGSRVAVPTPDELYFVREGTAENVDRLREATRSRYDEADYPLSDAIYRYERGEPVRAD